MHANKKWGNVLTRKSRGARRANCPNALRQWVIETLTIVVILKTIPWLPSQAWLRQLKKQVKTRQKGLLGQYWWTNIGKSYDAQRNHEWQHDPLITVRTTVMNGSNNWTKHTNIRLKANCGKMMNIHRWEQWRSKESWMSTRSTDYWARHGSNNWTKHTKINYRSQLWQKNELK